MEYGILIAESLIDDGDPVDYQIIGEVDSIEEAKRKAREYLVYGPESDCLAPDRFLIQSRGPGGWYTRREVLDL